MVGGHEEREQTLNQLLAEMDGFDTRKGVIILAATNRPEILDPALLRPGRFDRKVVVDRPDLKGREQILQVHARGVKLGPDVDLVGVAARTPGFVGADLANLVNEAALRAARAGDDGRSMSDFEEAIDRVVAGLERKSRVMNSEGEADRRLPRGGARAGGRVAARTRIASPRSRSFPAASRRWATPSNSRPRTATS